MFGKGVFGSWPFWIHSLGIYTFCIKAPFSSQQCCKYYLVCLPCGTSGPLSFSSICFQPQRWCEKGHNSQHWSITHNPTNKRLSMCGTLDWSVRLPEEIIVQEKNILKLCEIPLIQKFKGKNLTWVLLTGNPKFLPTFPVSMSSHILKSKIFSPDYLGVNFDLFVQLPTQKCWSCFIIHASLFLRFSKGLKFYYSNIS